MTDAAPLLSQHAEPTLLDVAEQVWDARRWVCIGAAAGFVIGLILLLLAVPQYKASMIVSPTTRTGTPDVSGLFPDNASFAMEYVLQSFGPGDSSDFSRFESILTEPSVAAALLKDPAVRDGLHHAKRWRLSLAPNIDDPGRLAAWLQDRIDIEPVGQTRLKRVTFEHPDPQFAAAMLNDVYVAADTLIRSELEDKTKKRIAYLNATLATEQNPDHQRALTKLLMDQEQIATVLAVHEPFAATLAEPPSTGPHAAWPRASILLPAAMLIGMVLAFAAFSLTGGRWPLKQ